VTTPWQGNWKGRLHSTIAARGYCVLEDFLAQHPGMSYVKLAASLGAARVAAMQICSEQLQRAAAVGRLREAAKDALVRFLADSIKRGWGRGGRFSYKPACALGDWTVCVLRCSGSPADAGLKGTLKKVGDYLQKCDPPVGWVPESPDDALIERAFAAARSGDT